MRYGIPLLAERVAPRCTFADSVLVVNVKGRRIRHESVVPLNGNTWADLAETLSDHEIDTLICGGISPSTRDSILSRDMKVVENVAGTRAEVVEALRGGRIRPGFGLAASRRRSTKSGGAGRGTPEPSFQEGAGPGGSEGEETGGDRDGTHAAGGAGDTPARGRKAGEAGAGAVVREAGTPPAPATEDGGSPERFGGTGEHPVRRSAPTSVPRDCLQCVDRRCLEGEGCPYLGPLTIPASQEETSRILESAWDVALEEERALCRIAELVYFALEMGYERLGVAFCEDLREPAEILTGVLRRFFEVEAIGCKLRFEPYGAASEGEEGLRNAALGSGVPCDPRGVAALLNYRQTELNVVVGFCVGSDCVFNRESNAPVTTIFLKDKSLANNPIGAVYSHYYLEDI